MSRAMARPARAALPISPRRTTANSVDESLRGEEGGETTARLDDGEEAGALLAGRPSWIQRFLNKAGGLPIQTSLCCESTFNIEKGSDGA